MPIMPIMRQMYPGHPRFWGAARLDDKCGVKGFITFCASDLSVTATRRSYIPGTFTDLVHAGLL
jgi:hypothetical protein